MSAQKIVNKFRKFGLPVDGVAILRNDILAIGDRTIDVHSCNYGYIRTSGRKRYSKGQQITGCDFLNNVTEDLFLVLIIDEGKKLEAYINAARQILDADSDVTILEIDVNKEAIQRAESIPPSLNKIAKISFQYTYQEIGKCDEGVCEYVEDVQCDVEPCESKSFCERVQECLPEPVDTDCTLQVGSGCCDYSVEGIELQTGVCITIPEIINVEDWGDTSEFSIGFQFGDEAQTTWFVNFSEPFEQITSDEIISALQLAYGEQQEVVFTYEINGNTICITPNINYIGICFVAEAGFLNDSGLASTAITDINLCNEFIINGQFAETDILCANAIENTCLPNDHAQNGLFLGSLNFQVLINDVWTDVTDEVTNGTWSRTNVCDDVITEWRVIDSEENVINSGDVTATCNEATEVTDSVCNWLQAHQTAIEELQNNPTGLTCETLSDCQTIIDIEQTLTEKANTADLATVATTGSYNDLSDQPNIPAAQIQSDWNQANNAAVDFIKNKPVIPTVPTNVSSFVNDAGYVNQAGARSALSFVAGSGAYNSGTGVITIPTNNNQITNGANYITIAQARAGSYTKFFADFANTAVNTNTTNNVIGSVLIPANTITGNTILEIESAISRATGGANPQHRLYINTSTSFGGTQIASLGISTTSLWIKGERSYKCAVGSLRGFSFTTAASIDDTANTNAPSATTPDWTVDQYILTVANNATGETTTHEYTTVKVLTV